MFKATYVKRTKTVAAFTKAIEKRMAQLYVQGWDIVETHLEADGLLLLCVRAGAGAAATEGPEERGDAEGEPKGVVLHPAALGFLAQLGQVMARTDPRAPDEKKKRIVEGVCRRYSPNELSEIEKNINDYHAEHLRLHHADGSACEHSAHLVKVLKQVQEFVRTSIS